MRLANYTLLAVIKSYQFVLSPWLGTNCRFMPTCSEYAKEALEKHGAMRGSLLTLKRLSRCHPFGGSGVDNPPER